MILHARHSLWKEKNVKKSLVHNFTFFLLDKAWHSDNIRNSVSFKEIKLRGSHTDQTQICFQCDWPFTQVQLHALYGIKTKSIFLQLFCWALIASLNIIYDVWWPNPVILQELPCIIECLFELWVIFKVVSCCFRWLETMCDEET